MWLPEKFLNININLRKSSQISSIDIFLNMSIDKVTLLVALASELTVTVL